MLHEFSRTEMLIGTEGLNKLKESTVAVFGIGGVGSFVVEGLVRSGIGNLVLVDDDDVCLTNLNRQIHATRKTVGKPKVEVMKKRVLEINPKVKVKTYKELYNSETADRLLSNDYDYVVDAIDMVSSKIDLIVRCNKRGLPIISCMGAGNKLNPTMLEVADLYDTSICPLARVMRRELKKQGIKKLKVVYSKEKPITPRQTEGNCKTDCICPNKERTCVVRRQIPGSVSFVPSVAGLIIASEVVKDLIGFNK
ncbi:tRNA threonylcarbamoyladenosine dehydratase [Thermohalobacter berrensis]|uniref:tRNA cyclic N6-threonylcarbamoyladenosine(37) synthase TcdA n=1 Tax=Thermohalobacter berrensis TaxID=99594 RepID=A0A419TB03_9FIRM|nr:tRNA threonylcarbamoyladenosine dehydratase [Thermohalobacter berrensis]RKD34641.1 tRNA cyclic N6-threonylcarbamoyladenosine(37) synthase TcdA [Thermohalobacter berrensis]